MNPKNSTNVHSASARHKYSSRATSGPGVSSPKPVLPVCQFCRLRFPAAVVNMGNMVDVFVDAWHCKYCCSIVGPESAHWIYLSQRIPRLNGGTCKPILVHNGRSTNCTLVNATIAAPSTSLASCSTKSDWSSSTAR